MPSGAEVPEDVLMEDDFEQLQSNPDPGRWSTHVSHPSGSVMVNNGMLVVNTVGRMSVHAETVLQLHDPYFRVEVGWMYQGDNGRPLEIELITRDEGMWETELILAYESPQDGWGFITNRDSPTTDIFTGIANATQGYRYDINITVKHERYTVIVTNVSSGSVAFEEELPIQLKDNTRVRIGAMSSRWESDIVATFDDFRIIDLRPPSLRPIEVAQPPVQVVTEGVPFIFDISPYVHDPDGDIDDLYVYHNNDPHVTAIDRLEVSFLFDEDGGEVEVPLTLTDGRRLTHTSIVFQVRDANDPPTIELRSPSPGDEYEVFDLVEIIFDVEDADSDDWIVEVTSDKDGNMETPYKWGWRYEVYFFPSEVGSHTFTINVSDGEYLAQEYVSVYVNPQHDDPLDSSSIESFACAIGCIVLILIMSLAGLAYWTTRKARQKAEMKPEADAWARRMWESERTGSVPWEGNRPRPTQPPTQSPRPETYMYAPSSYEGPEEIVFEPPEDITPPPVVTASKEEWRVQSVEEFEILLQELPEGLPEPLWGIPWWTLGKEVIASSMIREDGTLVCQVGGRTFHADKRDMDTFMQEVEH